MPREPQAGALRRATAPLLDQLIHSTARLVMHVTGAAQLDNAQLAHHTKVLKAFLEAIDALP